jgi:ADP-heptose:LPS heptosyltransferase
MARVAGLDSSLAFSVLRNFVKPKLLVIELWGLGDLCLATPFLQAAVRDYEVTLLAKPVALELQSRFWPEVKVVSLTAPWTAFQGKYHLYRWPWWELWRTLAELRGTQFDYAVSARWDPRDHALMFLTSVKRRVGFPRLGSRMFLTESLKRPKTHRHRYDFWHVAAKALNVGMLSRSSLMKAFDLRRGELLVHTGAGHPVRVWPLERYQQLVGELRRSGFTVRVACDPAQRAWWIERGESEVAVPATVQELFTMVDKAAAFIGNDSGPGHIAAVCGVPTLTIFGPQMPELFVPLHPASEWLDGRSCPYKPCSDRCRFSEPFCILEVRRETVVMRALSFAKKNLRTVPANVA